jgi:hypothetical protein
MTISSTFAKRIYEPTFSSRRRHHFSGWHFPLLKNVKLISARNFAPSLCKIQKLFSQETVEKHARAAALALEITQTHKCTLHPRAAEANWVMNKRNEAAAPSK